MADTVYLLETVPYDPGTAGFKNVNFSQNLLEETISGASVPYPVRLTAVYSHETSIFENNLPGQANTSIGTSVINNADGRFDYLLAYNWDNRVVTIKKGVRGAAYGTFTTEFVGLSVELNADGSNLVLVIKDNSLKLAKPLQPLKFAGTGGAEGGLELKGKTKPYLSGDARNISPVPVDTAKLTYMVTSTTLASVTTVYDKANPLTFSADYANYAALIAATIPPGSYATSLAVGFIRLGAPPEGQVTLDARGIYYSQYLGTQAYEAIKAQGGLVSGDFDTAAITTLATDFPYPYEGMYFYEPDLQLDDFLDIVASSMDAYWYLTRAGLIKIEQFKYRTASYTIRQEDLKSLGRASSPMPVHRVTVNYAKNPTVQGASDFVIPRQGFNGLLTKHYQFIATAADGSGGTYTTDAVFKVFLNNVQINSVGVVQFTVLSGNAWLAIDALGNISISNPGANTATGTVRANLGEFNVDMDFTVTRSLGALKTITLTPNVDHILITNAGVLQSPTNVVMTYVESGTTLSTMTVVDNLGNSYSPTTGSGISTLASSNVVNNPLVFWLKWIASDAAGIKQSRFTNIRRGIDPSLVVQGSDIGVSNGATTDLKLSLTSGSLASFVGNNLIAGGTDNYLNSAVGQAIYGPRYVEADIIAGANFTILAFDDDSTNGSNTNQVLFAYYRPSDGAIAVAWNNSASSYTGTTTTGLSGKMGIYYDNVVIKIVVGGNTVFTFSPTGLASTTWVNTLPTNWSTAYYPKWFAYTANSIMTSLKAGPYTDNNFANQGGATRPADNAGSNFTLVAAGTGFVTAQGNTVTLAGSAGTWNGWAYGRESITGTASISFRVPTYGANGPVVGLASQNNKTLNNYTTTDYGWYFSSSNAYYMESGTYSALVTGGIAATDVWSITYDGQYVRYIRNGTVLRTVASRVGQIFSPKVTFDSSTGGLTATVSDIQFTSYTNNSVGVLTLIPFGSGSVLGTSVFAPNTGAYSHGAYSDSFVSGPFDISATVENVSGLSWLGVITGTPGGNYTALNAAISTNGTGLYYWDADGYAAFSGSPTCAIGDVIRLTYDGLNLRYWRNGVLLKTKAATMTASYRVQVNSSGAGPGDRVFSRVYLGAFTDNLWASVGGPNRPSDNAGTSGILTGIGGGGPVIQGNSVYKTGGSNAYDAAAVGSPQTGTIFVSARIPDPVVTSPSGYGILALDNDGTSVIDSSLDFLGYIGWVGANYAVGIQNAAGTTLDSTTMSNGSITTSSVMALVYDGVSISLYIDGVRKATTTTGVAKGTKYWPKVICYNTASWVYKDIIYGPWSENSYLAISGPEMIIVKASPADIVETLPKTMPFKLLDAVGTDLTTSAAWSVSTIVGTGSYTIGASTGILSIDKSSGVLGGGLIEIVAVYQSRTVKLRVPIQIEFTLTKLLPEVGVSTSIGSARGTIQNFKQSLASGAHNQWNSLLGSNYAYVVSGPNGKINYQVDMQYSVANPNIGGYEQRMYLKYGAYPGGVLEPVAGTGSKAQTVPSDYEPGKCFATYQITGLTANTGYWVSAFECFVNVSGAPTTQAFEFWGTFSAYGE